MADEKTKCQNPVSEPIETTEGPSGLQIAEGVIKMAMLAFLVFIIIMSIDENEKDRREDREFRERVFRAKVEAVTTPRERDGLRLDGLPDELRLTDLPPGARILRVWKEQP